jgi:hypothetical protein
MLFNKWLKFGMDGMAALLAAMSVMDWTLILSPSAAMKMAGIISFIRMLMSSVAPAPGSKVAGPDDYIVKDANK